MKLGVLPPTISAEDVLRLWCAASSAHTAPLDWVGGFVSSTGNPHPPTTDWAASSHCAAAPCSPQTCSFPHWEGVWQHALLASSYFRCISCTQPGCQGAFPLSHCMYLSWEGFVLFIIFFNLYRGIFKRNIENDR